MFHDCAQGEEGICHNVDACAEVEVPHDDGYNVKVGDMEVGIRRGVQLGTSVHAVIHLKTSLDSEVARLQQLAYSPHVPSPDVKKDSMAGHDEENVMT